MGNWIEQLYNLNWVSLLIAGLVCISAWQGAKKGAGRSAKQLMVLVLEAAATIAAIAGSWKLMEWGSPLIKEWLVQKDIAIPRERMGGVQSFYYTFITTVRDFSLMRSGLLFLLAYLLIKPILGMVLYRSFGVFTQESAAGRSQPQGWFSSILGGGIGAVTGVGRAMLVIAVLFIFTVLMPHSSFAGYVQQSELYRKGANEVIQPFTGDFLQRNLPVFTRAVEEEFHHILQRKYEVLDAHVPDDIVLAAEQITSGLNTDEEKAKALYEWVGTRVAYDWEKVRMYEEERYWKEQTPEDTFRTREGVCIDYSRLYASMARSVGLDVKVVTGLGYDGRGGYGPHAWNEVWLAEKEEWVPLDSTWVSSGGNWFNPPDFYETHVKDV
ncbi:transglutaminase domain-containing protein [Paenibacillus senegalensis]|uniref:transglutaminase domain-containing protein n=1 Tax=Paenibacillus senegalensis TaxID=1465766 RepID=UPI000288BE88|nr:transglutaminase-like domain-containing protein [Paenibacillus senegalensis]